MNAGSKKQKGSVFYVLLYLAVLFFVVLPFTVAMVSVANDTVSYSLEYDRDPLCLRSVEVINRGKDYRDFRISSESTVCEIVITYENHSWYASEYGDRPEFYGIYQDIEEYLGGAWQNLDTDLYYEAYNENPIPAGQTGCRRYYVELWDGMTSIVVKEVSDKLEGKCAEVEVQIPEGDWDRIWVEAFLP